MKTWISAGEIADLGVSKLSTTQTATRRAKREGWTFRPASRQGGGVEYQVSTLPVEIREALVERDLAEQRAVAVAVPTPVSVAALSDRQRAIADARLLILREIERLAAVVSRRKAMTKLIAAAEAGTLQPVVAEAVAMANDKRGEERCLSERTIKRWQASYKASGIAGLAPKEAAAAPVPTWAKEFLGHWRKPNKPALSEALELLSKDMQKRGESPPSYWQVRAFVDRLGTIERNRGRMGPRELKNLKAYVKRDDSELDPLDVALMDGHTFDAEVAHPFHGGAFRPEVTTVVDAKTRLGLGVSFGLVESAEAVMDAVRDACQRFGVMALLYTDNGSGYEAAIVSGQTVGVLGRLGVTHIQSLPYNSQARGRSERSHQTIWVKYARSLPTFVGADMDPEAKTKVHKLVRKDLTHPGRKLLPSWADFVRGAGRALDEYNHRPHRGLPTIVDPATGKRRHQSPIEAYQAAVEAGFTPHQLTSTEAEGLFRPRREVTTHRGLVRLSKLDYYAAELVEHGGDRVLVAYEMNNPDQVWVETLDGRLICTAKLEGHAQNMIPMSMRDQARVTRVEQSLKRLDRDRDRKLAELPGRHLEAEPLQLTADDEAAAEAVLARFEAPIAEVVPISTVAVRWPGGEEERLAWLAANPAQVTASDLGWIDDRCRASRGFSMLHEDALVLIRAGQRVSAAG